MEEVEKALRSMGNGKTPGIDGLSVEFYKTFWSGKVQICWMY